MQVFDRSLVGVDVLVAHFGECLGGQDRTTSCLAMDQDRLIRLGARFGDLELGKPARDVDRARNGRRFEFSGLSNIDEYESGFVLDLVCCLFGVTAGRDLFLGRDQLDECNGHGGSFFCRWVEGGVMWGLDL